MAVRRGDGRAELAKRSPRRPQTCQPQGHVPEQPAGLNGRGVSGAAGCSRAFHASFAIVG